MASLLPNFEQLLKETIGLHAESIGSLSIERALQERQAFCCIEDQRAYWELLCSTPTELQALIEAVVVRETWFFREKEAFVAMIRIVQQEWLPQHSHDVLRLLSLPCATGEEPYSMAMALLDAGVPANRFLVDAIDISRRALDQAQGAIYGKNSFRSDELDFRDRHFTPTAQGYCVSDTARQSVRFQHGNIFAVDFLQGATVYDIVFCRNVLIYFDNHTQERAIAVLARLLADTGWLFVGSSETALLPSRGFVSAKVPLAFAFRKSVNQPAVKLPTIKRAKHVVPAAQTGRTPTPATNTFTRPVAITPSLAPASALALATLEHASQLADQGHLDQATTLCEQHTLSHGPSPQAFHLLGLIEDARGNRVAAADFYRKALYLNPQHSESLIHLAYLLEQQGDGAGARLLRGRLDRLNEKQKTK